MEPLKQENSALYAGISAGAIIFVLACLSTWFLYSQHSKFQFQLLKDEIENIGKVAALAVNVEEQKKLTKPEHTNNALYQELIRPLVDIHNTIPNLLYLYTMKEINGKVFYILDTTSNVRLNRETIAEGADVFEEYLFDIQNPLYIDWLETLRKGNIFTEPDFSLDEGEMILSTSIPLFDKDGEYVAMLGIDYNINIYNERQKAILQESMGVLLLALIISIILGWQVYVIRKKLEQKHFELYNQAHTDFLTGAYNRRHFFTQLEREMQRCQRHYHPLSLLMIDIDHFKQFNDTHGHLTGDQVLIQLVKTAKQMMRTNDIIARFGGEEFTILLPMTDTKGALAFANKLQDEISNLKINSKSGSKIQFTLSMGISGFSDELDVTSFIHLADEAMYKAKTSGRNQVRF